MVIFLKWRHPFDDDEVEAEYVVRNFCFKPYIETYYREYGCILMVKTHTLWLNVGAVDSEQYIIPSKQLFVVTVDVDDLYKQVFGDFNHPPKIPSRYEFVLPRTVIYSIIR